MVFRGARFYLAAYNSTQSSLLCASVLNKAVDEKEGEPRKDECVTENRLEVPISLLKASYQVVIVVRGEVMSYCVHLTMKTRFRVNWIQ